MRGMRIHSGVAIFTMVAALTLVAFAADEPKEKKISPADLPKTVADSVNGRFPGADITSAEKENEKGNVVYDLELKHEGRRYEMDVKEDGTILEIEKEIKAANVPQAVIHAVKAKYPHNTVKEVMEVNTVKAEETPDHYEVVLTTAGGKEKELIVSLDGKSVKEEGDEQPAAKEQR